MGSPKSASRKNDGASRAGETIRRDSRPKGAISRDRTAKLQSQGSTDNSVRRPVSLSLRQSGSDGDTETPGDACEPCKYPPSHLSRAIQPQMSESEAQARD